MVSTLGNLQGTSTNVPYFQPFSEEPIQLLSKKGEWIADFELDIPDEQLRAMYASMLSARLLDTRWQRLQRQGKVSFFASSAGHEGAQIAAAYALKKGHDWIFPYYRDTALTHSYGLSALHILSEYLGTSLNPNRSRQMPGHVSSREHHVFSVVSPIAAQLPPAVGMAMSMKYQKTGQVTLTSFGDGATSEGDFHAAMNLAGVQKTPTVFLCENNRYAISVGYEQQTAATNIAIKAQAYGMPGYYVDGMDVLASYYVLKQAIAEARDDYQPALVETLVYRYGAHSSADDDLRYRTQEEKDFWYSQDPIERFKKFLIGRDLWTQDWEDGLRESYESEQRDAVARNEAADAIADADLFDDVFAELSPQLEKQRYNLLGV